MNDKNKNIVCALQMSYCLVSTVLVQEAVLKEIVNSVDSIIKRGCIDIEKSI